MCSSGMSGIWMSFKFKAALARIQSFFPHEDANLPECCQENCAVQTDQWFQTNRKHAAFPQNFADVGFGIKFWCLGCCCNRFSVLHIRKLNDVTRRVGLSRQWLNQFFSWIYTSNIKHQTFATYYHVKGNWQVVVVFSRSHFNRAYTAKDLFRCIVCC